MRWPFSSAETSTGVAPERPKSVRDFSCPQKIPNGSSKLASSASSFFFAFRQSSRMVYRLARRFAWVFAAPQKPKFHYKRNVFGAFWSFWPPRAPPECPRSAPKTARYPRGVRTGAPKSPARKNQNPVVSWMFCRFRNTFVFFFP